VSEILLIGHQASLTRETIFEKSRTNLNEWFRMIILTVHTWRPPSTRKIKEELGIKSYDRALRMRKKIEGVLSGDTAYEQLVGIVEPLMLELKKIFLKVLQEREESEIINKTVDRLARQFEQMNFIMRKRKSGKGIFKGRKKV